MVGAFLIQTDGAGNQRLIQTIITSSGFMSGNAAAPVDDGAEYVEGEGFDGGEFRPHQVFRLIWRRLP